MLACGGWPGNVSVIRRQIPGVIVCEGDIVILVGKPDTHQEIRLESSNQLVTDLCKRSAYLLDSLRFLLCSLPGLLTKIAARPLPLPELLTESRLDGLLPGI